MKKKRVTTVFCIVGLVYLTITVFLVTVSAPPLDPYFTEKTGATTAISRYSAATQPEDGLINLNTATEEQLMSLPGIGKVLAGRIVGYREERGQFQSIEELKLIEGIGEKTFARIAPAVTV